jgi:lysophospholipase L1-like esterase
VRSPSRAGLAVNLALAAFSTLFFVAVLEIGARRLGGGAGFFLLPTATNCLQRDPLLSLSFRPDCRGDLAGTQMRTNSFGLRGPELNADGAVSILAAGDSCTWGWRVTEGQSYPAVLQSMLHDIAIQNTYQVINAGVPGYTSFQGLQYLRERGLGLRPSIVLIAYGFNDVFPTGDVELQIEHERNVLPLLRADDFLLNRSALYRWMRWRAEQNASRVREPRVSVNNYERNLRSMIELARARGIKVMIVSFWGPYVPEQDYRKAQLAVAKDAGVPLVTYEGERMDAVHPTAEGYADLARRVANRLVFEAWVQ